MAELADSRSLVRLANPRGGRWSRGFSPRRNHVPRGSRAARYHGGRHLWHRAGGHPPGAWIRWFRPRKPGGAHRPAVRRLSCRDVSPAVEHGRQRIRDHRVRRRGRRRGGWGRGVSWVGSVARIGWARTRVDGRVERVVLIRVACIPVNSAVAHPARSWVGSSRRRARCSVRSLRTGGRTAAARPPPTPRHRPSRLHGS